MAQFRRDPARVIATALAVEADQQDGVDGGQQPLQPVVDVAQQPAPDPAALVAAQRRFGRDHQSRPAVRLSGLARRAGVSLPADRDRAGKTGPRSGGQAQRDRPHQYVPPAIAERDALAEKILCADRNQGAEPAARNSCREQVPLHAGLMREDQLGLGARRAGRRHFAANYQLARLVPPALGYHRPSTIRPSPVPAQHHPAQSGPAQSGPRPPRRWSGPAATVAAGPTSPG